MIMENDVGDAILAGHGVHPQLLHEIDLIGEAWHRAIAILGNPILLHPIGQLPDKVEEELTLGYRNHCKRKFH